MKKNLCAFLILVFAVCACHKQNREINADIIIFTQQGCSHCEHAADFINNRLLIDHPSLQISWIDVTYDADNIKILKHYLQKYKFNKNHVGTPIIIFNDQLIMGWNVENKVKLQRAFASK